MVSFFPHHNEVTGFGYDHGAAWAQNIEFFKLLTDQARGVRRLGAASIDLCHVACGIVEAYWEYDLKPWDTCAGCIVLTEAGGKITTLDGQSYRWVPGHRKFNNVSVVRQPLESMDVPIHHACLLQSKSDIVLRYLCHITHLMSTLDPCYPFMSFSVPSTAPSWPPTAPSTLRCWRLLDNPPSLL